MSTRPATGGMMRGAARSSVLAAVLGALAAGCGGGDSSAVDEPGKMTIALTSPAFAEGASIPREYSCDGAGGSPPLKWSGGPAAAKELSLVVDDPDAPMGTFSHWVVVGLAPAAGGLEAGVPAGPNLPAGSILTEGEAAASSSTRQGRNDFGNDGYGGPCPPSGTHRYVFRLYALDAPLSLLAGSPTRSGVLAAIKGHVLAEGRLTGRYARSK